MPYVRPLDLDKDRPRAALNTTVDKEVLEGFKKHCKTCGIPMNIVIEQFMKQFQNNEFVISMKLDKDQKYYTEIEEPTEEKAE